MILINNFEKKLIYTILVILSVLLITCSLQTNFAADITINSSNNFKTIIENATSNSIIKLDSNVAEFSLNSSNVNIIINKTITIQSSNPEKNAVINLNKIGRAFNITSGGNLTLINTTIINGNTSYNTNGGAIYNNYGTITLTGCAFTENTARGHGGVIYNNMGTIILTECTFTGNTVDFDGSIIYNKGTVNLNVCTFTKNSATWDGGAIYNDDTAILIANNCIFTENKANDYGGTIYNKGRIILTKCVFTENNAINFGGAIINFGVANLTDCSFTKNTAGKGGAIFNSGVANLTKCSFTENKANEYGGAIYNEMNLTFTGCNFTKNTASRGGAIYIINGEVIFIYCNFTENTASSDGGAIYNHGDETISIANNCTFTKNTATYYYGGAIYNTGSVNLTGCNFTENKATTRFGGAIYNHVGAILNATNCMFTANIASNNSIMGFSGSAIYNNGTARATGCNFTEYKYISYDGPIIYGDVTRINCKYNVLINTSLNITTNVSNDKIIISVIAIDKVVGQSIFGKTIYFYVDGKIVGSGTTNNNGVANFVHTTFKSGTHIVEAKIDGFTDMISVYNIIYSATTATKNVDINIIPDSYLAKTNLTITTVVSGNKIIITAKAFYEKTSQVIVGATIYFYVNETFLVSNQTDKFGVATYVYTASKSGQHIITGMINGYIPSIQGLPISHPAVMLSVDSKASLTPAKLKLNNVKTSKPTKKKGKKIYTKTYIYKNTGHITGSKTFTISVPKKYKLTGKITKSTNVDIKYNKKTKKISITIKNLAHNKIAQVKFKIL